MNKKILLLCSFILTGIFLTGCAASNSDSSNVSSEETMQELEFSNSTTLQEKSDITNTGFTKEELEENAKTLYDAVWHTIKDFKEKGQPLPECPVLIFKDYIWVEDVTKKELLDIDNFRETVCNYINVSSVELTALEANYMIVISDTYLSDVILASNSIFASYPYDDMANEFVSVFCDLDVSDDEDCDIVLSVLENPQKYFENIDDMDHNASDLFSTVSTVFHEIKEENTELLPIGKTIITKDNIYYTHSSDSERFDSDYFMQKMKEYTLNYDLESYDNFIIVIDYKGCQGAYLFFDDKMGCCPEDTATENGSTFDEVLENLKRNTKQETMNSCAAAFGSAGIDAISELGEEGKILDEVNKSKGIIITKDNFYYVSVSGNLSEEDKLVLDCFKEQTKNEFTILDEFDNFIFVVSNNEFGAYLFSDNIEGSYIYDSSNSSYAPSENNETFDEVLERLKNSLTSSGSNSSSSSSHSSKSSSHDSSSSSSNDSTGEYYCMGKNDTCTNKTSSPYDFYCHSCDPDDNNIEGDQRDGKIGDNDGNGKVDEDDWEIEWNEYLNDKLKDY